jgi:hypothetical protein
VNTEKPGVGITGEPEGGEPADEREHFEVCPVCGQAFDLRNLDQVIHHGRPDNQPLPTDS